jgi:hypothetical protein
MDQGVATILFIAAVLVFAGLLMAVITLTRKGPRQLDVEQYRSQWLAIETQLQRDNPSSYQMAILNADKLLDKALRDRNMSGETMGERMKSAKTLWSNANTIWTAHKLRNQIAHESDVKVTYESARRALGAFKQALKDMGAI